MAASVLTLPASSAATERSFSSFEVIHTKKRNRLTNDRLNKLVFVRHNSRLLSNSNYHDMDPDSDEENTDEDDEKSNDSIEEMMVIGD